MPANHFVFQSVAFSNAYGIIMQTVSLYQNASKTLTIQSKHRGIR